MLRPPGIGECLPAAALLLTYDYLICRCWIEAKPVYLRYVLTHGWRFLFIIIEVCFYVI